jgi:hypothetical protein
MISRTLPITRPFFTILAALVALSTTLLADPVDEPVPGPVGRHEISTRDDLLFAHLLGPLMKGEVSEWPVLGGLGKRLGDWVDQFVGAQQIANIITADRAGLLCCGEPKVAYRAIMRLQHGLNKDSPWIDPEAADFDPRAVIRTFQQWQYRPFVRLLVDLKRHTLANPFVPERLAALKAWVDAGAYRSILDRPDRVRPDRLIEVVEIQAFELASEGQAIDPYVVVFDGDHQILTTATAPGRREARWSGFKGTDPGVEQPRPFEDGRPLFFEIWDSDYGPDSFVGGFAIYPDGRDARSSEAGEMHAEYTARILWDWKDPRAISRAGHGRVTVRFLRRQPAPRRESSGKAGS